MNCGTGVIVGRSVVVTGRTTACAAPHFFRRVRKRRTVTSGEKNLPKIAFCPIKQNGSSTQAGLPQSTKLVTTAGSAKTPARYVLPSIEKNSKFIGKFINCRGRCSSRGVGSDVCRRGSPAGEVVSVCAGCATGDNDYNWSRATRATTLVQPDEQKR